MSKRLAGIGSSLSRFLREAAENSDVEIVSGEDLGATLEQLEAGNLQALSGIAEALMTRARYGFVPADSVRESQVYGPDFFARDPSEVAKDLCGQVITYSHLDEFFMGVVNATGGYSNLDPEDNRRFPTAIATPGTIGSYNSRGPITIISAHEPNQNGFVAVWGLILPDGSNHSMTNAGRSLHVKEHSGEVVGSNTGVYQLALASPGMESVLAHARLEANPRDLQKYSPDASFRLKMRR
jgi:hypothetical protein